MCHKLTWNVKMKSGLGWFTNLALKPPPGGKPSSGSIESVCIRYGKAAASGVSSLSKISVQQQQKIFNINDTNINYLK